MSKISAVIQMLLGENHCLADHVWHLTKTYKHLPVKAHMTVFAFNLLALLKLGKKPKLINSPKEVKINQQCTSL